MEETNTLHNTVWKKKKEKRYIYVAKNNYQPCHFDVPFEKPMKKKEEEYLMDGQ